MTPELKLIHFIQYVYIIIYLIYIINLLEGFWLFQLL